MASRQANPLPSDGVVGKLTPQQESSLKVRSLPRISAPLSSSDRRSHRFTRSQDMWREFLQLIDSAPKEGSGGVSEVQVVDEKAPGNSIPKVREDEGPASCKSFLTLPLLLFIGRQC